MDSLSAMAMGMAAKGNPQRVFDWDKAATLIRERKPVEASAGLAGDWDWTGGTIYENGQPVAAEKTYVYLSSNWATPTLNMDGDEVECWKYASETPGWNEHTYWPESARELLGK